MLSFDTPAPNWVKIANGMGVEAARATDAVEFNDLFSAALSTRGPFLIEAII
jgi:acetolactate synthase-1/2/3 large subunit